MRGTVKYDILEDIYMASSCERWIDGLQFSSLFWPPPQDVQQRKV
ncbi:hypothetical protein CK203_034606 [Vitis vinifera]|uniref:Uncharacterized protein n=1 Tax=Vitis vinifera TaxID=29760 RepID=A0A438IDT1_VITVI|nr:hypothetical protein CK203_081697 [Vitis vinifera]RVW94837.1 hypothetical protein CK203_034606 [Vitis vinifera]